MERYQFPFSNADSVVGKLAGAAPEAKAALKKRPAEDGTLEASRMREILMAAGAVNEQEVETAVRAFATADGRVDYAGFLTKVGA
jgi:hypothetical protein